jgi:hypothetical protein
MQAVIEFVLKLRPLHLGDGGNVRLGGLALALVGVRVDPLKHQVGAALEALHPDGYSLLRHVALLYRVRCHGPPWR